MESESENEEELHAEKSSESDLEENESHLCAAIKRKKDDKLESSPGKKIHRSLKDNPRPIATPALRKKKKMN